MADNSIEIERLRKEIQRVNTEISQLESEYERRLNQELTRMKNEFAQSTAVQQQDFTERFKKLEKSLCDAYLFETEKIKERYESLVDQVNLYETQLEEEIQKIIQEQEKLLREKNRMNEKERISAQQSIEVLNQRIQNACRFPVDLFYPHALQRYIDAGKEAERLLKMKLYSFAFAKADCACMAVKRLTDDTATKVHELESMFGIYSIRLKAIMDYLKTSESRMRIEDNEIVLELSEIDLNYWSDLLYSDIQVVLLKHQDIINGGVDGWLSSCQASGISPSLQLDKEMQKLDSIPQKLRTCVSYALSACDCYNYLSHIKSVADEVLSGQNYSFVSIKYGKVRNKNELTNGYKFYYDNWLVREQCIYESLKPDYREERLLIYQKEYADGKVDQCRIFVVPVRTNNTVSFEVYLQFDTDYLPTIISEKIRRLFIASGINVNILVKTDMIPTQTDRPLSLETLNRLIPEQSESTLVSKYSLNL